MERIKLTKAEKKVLRELKRGNSDVPNGMDNFSHVDAVASLRGKGLVSAQFSEKNHVVGARLTVKGHAYINGNPNLCNPVEWTKIAAIGSIVSAIGIIIGLFVGCTLLK
ncbi:MAG: hypothetical protein NC324_03135 [Bacteroides sp.]|nr:hypothetical protein [Bacteroides sp.]